MEELLKKILTELEFHSKLLSELVTGIDEKKHEHQDSKIEINKKIAELSKHFEGTPYATILQEVLKSLGGK